VPGERVKRRGLYGQGGRCRAVTHSPWHCATRRDQNGGTDKLYYPMREDNRVLVVDTRTDTITKIIPIEGGPVGVGFAPNGEVWIHNDRDGAVHVIDGRKDEVVKMLKGLGEGAGRMAVSPDGRWAAFAAAVRKNRRRLDS
jgi:YVTN family beta-propeller protein